MPSRVIVAKELAEIFKVLSHPDRIRLVEELHKGELDVSTLAETLGLTGPRASQHLTQLRLRGIVAERREGRHHYYSLVQAELASWIVEGLAFLGSRDAVLPKSKIDSARRKWTTKNPGASRARE